MIFRLKIGLRCWSAGKRWPRTTTCVQSESGVRREDMFRQVHPVIRGEMRRTNGAMPRRGQYFAFFPNGPLCRLFVLLWSGFLHPMRVCLRVQAAGFDFFTPDSAGACTFFPRVRLTLKFPKVAC